MPPRAVSLQSMLDPDAPAFADDYFAMRRKDAVRGSQSLKEAIFRSWGIELKVVTPNDPPPKVRPFKKRPKPCGGVPRGQRQRSKKIRVIDPQAFAISTAIAQHFDIAVADMEGATRTYAISHPRQIAMYAIRKRRALSFPDIALHFGGKDHTTVVHAVKQVERRIKEGDPDTIKALNMIHKVFGA